MPIADINYIAVIVCTVISMLIGFVWYSFQLFGKQWMVAAGLKKDQIEKAPSTGYAIAVLSALLSSYVLAHFIDYSLADTFVEGAMTGFWVWIGFVASSMAMNAAFEQRPATLFYINAGMQLVNLLIIGGILAVWR
jgi:hypothetical protein